MRAYIHINLHIYISTYVWKREEETKEDTKQQIVRPRWSSLTISKERTRRRVLGWQTMLMRNIIISNQEHTMSLGIRQQVEILMAHKICLGMRTISRSFRV